MDEFYYIVYAEKLEIEKLQIRRRQLTKRCCLKFWIYLQIFYQNFRAWLRKIVTATLFEYVALAIIMANAITLAIDEDRQGEGETRDDWWSRWREDIDTYFLVVFVVEMLMKVIAFGFIRAQDSYMRNSWNVFDFFIVMVSLVAKVTNQGEEATGSLNLSILRSIRVLRPLRTITKLKRLKQIVSTILASLPELFEIMILLFVFLSVMAIAGVQLFMGTLKRRCVSEANPSELGRPCGNSVCPAGFVCMDEQLNPNYGLTNFDNFLSSLLMVRGKKRC